MSLLDRLHQMLLPSGGEVPTAERAAGEIASQYAERRQRAFTVMAGNRASINTAPHYNALSHVAGHAFGYLRATFDQGLLTRDEAIAENNAIAIAVNLRTPSLMMDVVDTRVVH